MEDPSHVPVTREGESRLFHKAAVSLTKEHQQTFIQQVEAVHREKKRKEKKNARIPGQCCVGRIFGP